MYSLKNKNKKQKTHLKKDDQQNLGKQIYFKSGKSVNNMISPVSHFSFFMLTKEKLLTTY